MKNVYITWIAFLAAVFFSTELMAGEAADVIVAQDGSGDYTSVQAALDAAPDDATDYYIIFVKNGTYDEQIFIEKSFIALVGENRDSTIIQYPVKRTDVNPDILFDLVNDWGAASMQISADAKNIVLANMTVKNNYFDVHPDEPVAHAFAVRGGGDKVMSVNCNFISGGGDTFSLWGNVFYETRETYYYQKDCYFEGGIDFVPLGGWSYTEDCRYFGLATQAILWHFGHNDPDEKYVVRNSYFDGEPNFGLGRYPRDHQFYILDCLLSERALDDGGIKPAGGVIPEHGVRVYYYNTHRETGDFEWMQDNLWEAINLPGPEDVTPLWTFQGKWDPETELPSVLPFAYMPKPKDSQKKVSLNPELRWIAGRNAESHDVYFGTSNPPAFVTNIGEATYSPSTLQPNTTYYWKVDEKTADGTIEGKIWSFKTYADVVPPKASNPYPPNDSTNIEGSLEKMTWDMDTEIADTSKLYMGTHPDSLKLVQVYSIGGYQPPPLVIGETYYWRVDLSNQFGTTTGDVWQFSMKESYYNKPDYYQTNDATGLVSIEAENFTDSTNIGDHYWGLVTDPGDFSGTGAMQALPDDGTFYNTRYFDRSSRLDYAVNFIKTGTHYIWVRAYAPSTNSNTIHMGINFQEDRSSSRIGDFKGTGQWEWIHALANDTTQVRSFNVDLIGTQGVSLWFGEDGVIVDKIVLTTDSSYVPASYGPGATTSIEKPVENKIPQGFKLYQNYPNPFNPATTIRYDLAKPSHVELTIYDNLGRKVATLIKTFQNAGSHSVRWESNKAGLSSGVYFARLTTGTFKKTIKLLLIQ